MHVLHNAAAFLSASLQVFFFRSALSQYSCAAVLCGKAHKHRERSFGCIRLRLAGNFRPNFLEK